MNEINKIKNINLELAPSKVHGVGLFAIRPISKNTIIFRYKNPNMMDYYYSDLKKADIKQSTINTLKRLYAHNDKYIQLPQKFSPDTFHYVNFVNHSNKPNIYYDNGKYITRRNIKKGEEIFLDYSENGYCPSCLDF